MNSGKEKQIGALWAFVHGVFWTTIVFLITFMVLDFGLQDSAWIGMLGSILVAAFTITAAWFALEGNRAQIRRADLLEEDRRQNALVAARAILPAVLSEMILIAENNLRYYFEPGHEPIGSEHSPATKLISLPPDLLPPFKECIEHADPISQERMANVLRHFQVQQSRSRSKSMQPLKPHFEEIEFTVPIHNAISNAIGWAIVYALIGDMFGYARGGYSSIPAKLDPHNVRAAFALSGITLEQFANLNKILEQRIEHDSLERDWRN